MSRGLHKCIYLNRRWLSCGMLSRVVWHVLTDVSGVLTASIITATSPHRQCLPQRSIPEDNHLHCRCCNLQSHMFNLLQVTQKPCIPVSKETYTTYFIFISSKTLEAIITGIMEALHTTTSTTSTRLHGTIFRKTVIFTGLVV
jgi:hypothetical protein